MDCRTAQGEASAAAAAAEAPAAAARDEASDEEYDPFATVILDEGDDIVQCLRCTVRLRPVRRFVGQLRHWYWCQFPGEETNWGKWFVQR